MLRVWAKTAAAGAVALCASHAARAQEPIRLDASATAAAYYHSYDSSARDAAMIALAIEQELQLAGAVGPEEIIARLPEGRRFDLEERGVDASALPAMLARCTGVIDFAALSEQRLRAPLAADAAPSLWRARTIVNAAGDRAHFVAAYDPERPLRDVLLDTIVGYCVSDLQ